nr:hypothetical protein [Desulfurococcales archaeon]
LGSAPRRILCKHVLAVLAKLVEEGAVDLESSLWREALREALLAARARLQRQVVGPIAKD